MPSPSIATILQDHVSLSISCVDRLYLNGYVPLLQTPGHIATFCRQQLHAPIASPALFRPLLERFTHAVDAFAEQHNVPIIHFSRTSQLKMASSLSALPRRRPAASKATRTPPTQA
jgi:hypothetical protein